MAQSDQTVQNATFPNVRIDINDNLAALFSQSSGNSAPTVTVAFQPWIDTSGSPALWKVRNAANNGWITIGSISATEFLSAGGFPFGTVMLFVQTTAPTGWTKSTTHNDKALRVVSGTASSGGSTAFSSVFASRTPAGSVGSTTLTTAQIPSHTHTWTGYAGNGGAPSVGSDFNDTPSTITTSATGNGGSHTHGFIGSAMDFAVQYVDVIIATKN